MECAVRVLVEAVIARARPVAVVVDERVVERQEAEGPVDVQNGCQSRLEPARWRLIQDLAQVDEVRPRFGIVFGLDLEEAPVGPRIVSEVFETRASARAARRGPARALRCPEVVAQEVLVERLHVGIHTPALAVDDHAHEVRSWRGHVVAGNLGVEHRLEECRILVRVQEVQRAIPLQLLIAVREVEVDGQRMLAPHGHHAERRVAAEPHADVAVRLAVHDDRRGHVHIGVVEVGELGLPVCLLELDEECPQRAGLVERRVRIRLHVGRRQVRSRIRRHPSSATESESPPLSPARVDVFASGLSLCRVQPAIAVLVELLENLEVAPAESPEAARESLAESNRLRLPDCLAADDDVRPRRRAVAEQPRHG